MIKSILDIFFPAISLSRSHVAAVTIGAAAVGAAGSYAASSNAADAQKSAAANANAPWSQAQPYITYGYGQDQTAYQNALGMGTYSGERVADLNPYQTQAANSAAAYANGNGANTANQFYNTGMGLTGAGSAYGSNAQSLLSQVQGNSADNMQGFFNAGNQLANSSTTQGLIDSANMNVSRELNQSTLPSLLSQGIGQGGNDNTRTGVAMGLAQSQAQQNMLANASNIQGQMFNEGMQGAQNQFNAQQQQALAANQQVGGAYSMGSQGLLNGQQATGNNFDELSAAGGMYQNQQQAVDNAAQTQFQQQQQTPMDLLAQYQAIINGEYGGPAVSSVGPSAAGSALQGAVGGAMQGYGASKLLGGYNNDASSSFGPFGSGSGINGSYTNGTYAPGETSSSVNYNGAGTYYDNGIN